MRLLGKPIDLDSFYKSADKDLFFLKFFETLSMKYFSYSVLVFCLVEPSTGRLIVTQCVLSTRISSVYSLLALFVLQCNLSIVVNVFELLLKTCCFQIKRQGKELCLHC